MKTIAFYITDSGFGHLMRDLALVEELLSNTAYHVAIACGRRQLDYARGALELYGSRVFYIEAETDPGTVFEEDSLKVDAAATARGAAAYLERLDRLVDEQEALLADKGAVLLVADISVLGILTGKRLGIRTVGISNYTWYNRFEHYGLDEAVLSQYRAIYNQLDHLYMYAYSDAMTGIDCPKEAVGFISREVDKDNVGFLSKNYWPAVYLSIGQVAQKGHLKVDFPGGTVFATGQLEIEGNARLVKLPPNTASSLDYIKASAFAIIKGGWATVSECLVNKVPIGVVAVEGGEDAQLCKKLVDDRLAFETTEEELADFNIQTFNIKAAGTKKLDVENAVKDIAKKLAEQAG